MRTAGRWLLLLCLGPGGQVPALELSPQEAAGKRLYRQGLGAGDGEVHARVGAAGTLLPARLTPCANCHGGDGRGRPEGGVRPPGITWRRLTLPYGARRSHGLVRPPYDEAAFARAVTDGLDPAGRRLDPAMPRFVMSMRDMANLTAYLKRLEDDADPGIEAGVLRIGTLLPTAGPFAAMGNSVQAVMTALFEQINAGGGIHGRRLELVRSDAGTTAAGTDAGLARLLEQERVFALLSPLVPGAEHRLAALADAAGLPLIGGFRLPDDGAYHDRVFRLQPGVREQLLVLGTFADRRLPAAAREAQILSPPGTAEPARALADALRRLGWPRVQVRHYGPGEIRALAENAARSLFFVGSSADFAALAAALDAAGHHPYLLALSEQVAGAVLALPGDFSGRVFLAYPFLPGDWTPAGRAGLAAARRQGELDGRHTALQVEAYNAVRVLEEGLKRAGRELSRDRLVAELEQLHGLETGLGPPLSFGPGRRIGAAGAHVVRVDIRARQFRPTGAYIRLASPP